MASSLPEELVQEILVRFPLDEPDHLARASLVCKTWRRVVLSNRVSFWRRCREFHGAPPPPPPLVGYIQNPYHDGSPMRFVYTTISIAPPAISMPSGWCALDCRHGRVLILDAKGDPSKRLIVWDPITGSQQHLSVPSASYSSFPSYSYAGAVLCAKHHNGGGGCDHLDCHGGPFHVVLVEANRVFRGQFAIATKYSSLTSAWGAPTSNNGINHRAFHLFFSGNLHIGDALYFLYENGQGIIIEYDLRAHSLSEISLPQHLYGATLMKAEDGGLGLAALKDDNCIHLWSRRHDVPDVIGWCLEERRQWAECKVIDLGTLVPRHVPFEAYKLIGFAEGTNSIFINISTGIFMLDLNNKQKVRKVGERQQADRADPILPYMSFYVPRHVPNLEHVKLEAELVAEKKANAFVRTYLRLFLTLGWVKSLCNSDAR